MDKTCSIRMHDDVLPSLHQLENTRNGIPAWRHPERNLSVVPLRITMPRLCRGGVSNEDPRCVETRDQFLVEPIGIVLTVEE